MGPTRASFAALISSVLLACGGARREEPIAPIEPPPQPAPIAPSEEPAATPATAPAPSTSTSAGPLPALPSQAPRYAPVEPPPETQWTQAYSSGRWVYTADDGWVWVPAGSIASEVDGVPYAYLYTPAWGWTWYLSPWGWGPYHYGVWVRHPWRPAGWRGPWVAHPHVVVRLGRGWHHR